MVQESTEFFIDANIPIYAAGRDSEFKDACLALLDHGAAGRLRLVSSVEIVQEVVYHYSHTGRLEQGLQIVQDFLTALPLVLPLELVDVYAMLELLKDHPGVPPRDALHYAVMEHNGITHIITADRHCAALPGIICLDPREAVRLLDLSEIQPGEGAGRPPESE